MTAEEARAKAWCDAREQRKRYEQANAARLAGSPSKLKQLCLAWKPILSLQREIRYGTQEDE